MTMPVDAEATSPLGDCRAVFDVKAQRYLENTDLSTKQCSLGSVTKSMTLYLALEAQKDGLFKDSDVLPLSTFSTTFRCTCIGGAAVDPAVDTGEEEADYAQPGERFRWDDLLAGVALSQAEPTLTVAEYVARRRSGQGVTNSISSEQAVMKFVTLMNAKAKELGLNNSVFRNPHGGIGFAPGTPEGVNYDSRTSAADMTQLWYLAHTRFEAWERYMGLTSRFVRGTLPNGQFRDYTFVKGYGQLYAGTVADKNGSNSQDPQTEDFCFQCQIVLLRRLGREFLIDVQMSDDVVTAINALARQYLFQAFKPARAGEATAPGPGTGGIDLACRATGSCYSLETRAGKLIGRYWISGSETVHKLARELPGTEGTAEHDMASLQDAGKYRAITIRRGSAGVTVAAMYLSSSGPALAPGATLPAPSTGPVAAASFKGGAITAHSATDGVMLTRWAIDPTSGALTKSSEVKLPVLGGKTIVMDKVDATRSTAAVAYKGADGRVSAYAYRPGEDVGAAPGTLISRGVGTGPPVTSNGLDDVTDLVPTGGERYAVIGIGPGGYISNVLMSFADGGVNNLIGIAPTRFRPSTGFPVVGAAVGSADDWGMVQLTARYPSEKQMTVIVTEPSPGYLRGSENILSLNLSGSVTAVGDIERVAPVKAANDGEHVVAIRTTTGRTKLIRFRTGQLPAKSR